MRRLHISLSIISLRNNLIWGSLGGGYDLPSELLKSSLRQFDIPPKHSIPLGHLAAELRESNELFVKSVDLQYSDHPHKRTLSDGETDDTQGRNNIFSELPSLSTLTSNASSPELSVSSSTASATSPPSVAPTFKHTEPIRIHFDTTEMEKKASADGSLKSGIETIKNSVLPKVSEIWSSILSVTPVQENILVDDNTCYGFIDFTSNMLEEGVSDTDLLIFVTAHNTINGFTLCDKNALASASYCSLDQYDRPVIGFINFCVENVNAEKNEDAVVAIGVHELTHVLGFSDDLFKFFRDSNGKPLTQRPFKKTSVKCVDGSVRSTILASDSVIKSTEDDDGSVSFEIVSPTVADIVRNHFNCEEMSGARLENQPTRNSCTGSHWDERYFFTDIMSPIFSSDSVSLLSPLTVALIKDTGWYQVSFASKHIKNSPFGLGAGCDFLVENSCIVDNKVPEEYGEFFCDSVTTFTKNGYPNKSSQTTCDPSFSHIGKLNISL